MFTFTLILTLIAWEGDMYEQIDAYVDEAYEQATFEHDEEALDWGKQEDCS